MTRETSALSWEQLQTSDQLTSARRHVYDALCALGPMTAGELTAHLKDETETRPSYHKRLSELLRQGCVRERKVRSCRVSGRDCIEWEAIPGVTPQPLKHTTGRSALEKRVIKAAYEFARRPTALRRVALLTAAARLQKETQ